MKVFIVTLLLTHWKNVAMQQVVQIETADINKPIWLETISEMYRMDETVSIHLLYNQTNVYEAVKNVRLQLDSLINKLECAESTECETEASWINQSIRTVEEGIHQLQLQSHTRKKRQVEIFGKWLKSWTGVMDHDDQLTIQQNFDKIEKNADKVVEFANQQRQILINMTDFQKESTGLLLKQNQHFNNFRNLTHMLSLLKLEAETMERTVSSLLSTIQNKKLSNKVISFNTLQDIIDKKRMTVDTSHKMMYDSALDWIASEYVEVLYVEDEIRISIQLPIIHTEKWTLKKVHKLPLIIKNMVSILDIKENFIATSNTSMITFGDLKSCKKYMKIHVCNTDIRPIQQWIDRHTCISKIIQTQHIDLDMCKDLLRTIKLTDIMTIRTEPDTLVIANPGRKVKIESICQHQTIETVIYTEKSITARIPGACQLKVDDSLVFKSMKRRETAAVYQPKEIQQLVVKTEHLMNDLNEKYVIPPEIHQHFESLAQLRDIIEKTELKPMDTLDKIKEDAVGWSIGGIAVLIIIIIGCICCIRGR